MVSSATAIRIRRESGDSAPPLRGNSAGAFRATGVHLEGASSGGYNLGWVTAGAWLAHTVNVASAGSCSAQFR